ncbi:hypothetical protein GCM10011386_18730 [Parapedobacter defluvii]|uniref:Lipoprotein n=1 Tax=Parapedobacter defluvii TaxID=2045106 RepID=A0ABQ1LNQ6_9SPHI|nr:hypothetical protein [Parapedobacter defluvii]GGC26903.1 hypothetical protein GCM10011386_18730 [Parapedobacter defluvii]
MNTNKSIFGMLFITGFLLISGCKKDGGTGPLGCKAERESAAYQQAIEAYVADPSSVENCERLKQTATTLLEKIKNCTLANRKELEEAIAQYEDIDCTNP